MPNSIKTNGKSQPQTYKSVARPSKTGIFLTSLLLFNPLARAVAADLNCNSPNMIQDPALNSGVLDPNNFAEASAHVPQSREEEICSQTYILPVNKANGVILGSADENFIPYACIKNKESSQCANDVILQDNLKEANKGLAPRYKWVYEGRQRAYQSWFERNVGMISRIKNSLNSEQSEAFMNMLIVMEKLMRTFLAQSYAQNDAGRVGNCMEHTSVTLHKLLEEKIKSGSKVKIQYVEVEASKAKKGIKDHVYLLLDSNLPNKRIQKNRKFVEDFFKSLKKGKICDTWNNGFYDDFAKTENKDFYQRGAGWDTLEITTIDLDFAGFEILPEEAQQFICEELKKMNLLSKKMEKKCAFAS